MPSLLIGPPHRRASRASPWRGSKCSCATAGESARSRSQRRISPISRCLSPWRASGCKVFGAGKIAARRIRSLLGFGCTIEVIAPQLDESLEQDALQGQNGLASATLAARRLCGRPCPWRRPTTMRSTGRLCRSAGRRAFCPTEVRLPGGLRFLFPRSGAGRGVDHRPLFQRGGPQKGKGCGGMAAGSHRPSVRRRSKEQMAKRIIRVGSRESTLAVAQTRIVMEQIQAHHPELELETG